MIKDNCNLKNEIIRDGHIHIIPISKPVSHFYCKGYVVIGDGANMTVRLIGSRITNSIVAGTIYMTKRGWEDASLNCIKKLLLNLDQKSIDFLLIIIEANDLLTCYAGRELKLKPIYLISRGLRGVSNIKLLLRFVKAYVCSRKIINIVKIMPEVYDEVKISKFIKKYGKL